MDKPIHAANNVDGEETLPKVIAAVAGVILVLIVAGVVAFTTWNPPQSTKAPVQHTAAAGIR